MFQFKKTVVATAVACAILALTACTDDISDSDYEAHLKSNVVAQATMDQSNVEKDAAYRLTRELRAVDPTIQSVDPVIINGARSIEVSRSRPDGSVEVWKMDPEKYATMITSAESKATATDPKLAQNKEEGSGAFGSSLGGAMTGALIGSIAGNLIGNMFNPSQGVNRGFSNYSQYSQYNDGVRRTYTSNLSSSTASQYDRERERERRSGGGYVSPFIGSNATAHAAAAGRPGYKYSGVATGAPSRTAAASSSGGRSSSSGTAFSSGARGSASSGG